MTFGDSATFLFVMLLASVLVAAVIFAGSIAVSFLYRAKPIAETAAEVGE